MNLLWMLGTCALVAATATAHPLHADPIVRRDEVGILAGPYNLAFFNRHNEAYRTSAAVHYVHAKQHDVLQLTPLDRHAEWDTRFNDDVLAFLNGQPHTGLLAILANWLLSVTGGDLTVTAMAILWSSAILSSIVDNIPFVATMIPLIKEMAPTFGGPEGLMPLWWALSLGACLGGNGTIVGASANLTVAGMAERTGIRFSFIEYMKVGYPMMLVSVVIATAYLYLRYLLINRVRFPPPAAAQVPAGLCSGAQPL